MLNIVCITVMFFVLICLGMFYFEWLDFTSEESFSFAIMSVMLILYITGLMGDTRLGLLFIIALAGTGLIRYLLKRKNPLRFFSPGIVMVFMAFVFAIGAFWNLKLCNWDELYQWGKAANYMVKQDALPYGELFAGEDTLLSSTTFFHYFVSKFSYLMTGKVITESNYYVSNVLLWFSALILPFSGTGWRGAKRVFGFGLLHFLASGLIFVQPYFNIYCDQPVAYWAGATIAWYLMDNRTKKSNLLLAALILNIGLMKNMVGPLFAAVCVLTVIIIELRNDMCCGVKRMLRRYRGAEGWKKLAAAAGLCVCTVLPTMIWSFVIKSNAVVRSGTVEEIGENRVKLTIRAMVEKLFESVNLQKSFPYITFLVFLVFAVIMAMVIVPLVMRKKEAAKWKFVLSIYILGFGVYFLFLLYAYLNIFSYADSIVAGSLNRYLSDYIMLGIVAVTMPLFVEKSKRVGEREWISKAIVILLVGFSLYGVNDYLLDDMFSFYYNDDKVYQTRMDLENCRDQIYSLTDEEFLENDSKIYFVCQEDNGYYTVAAEYLYENKIKRYGMCYNFREEGDKDKDGAVVGLMEYSIEQLPQILFNKNYEYLWIYNTNDFFTENFKKQFHIGTVSEGSFYKIHKNNGMVTLELLDIVK